MKKLINKLSFLSLLFIIQVNTVKSQGTYSFNGHYLYSPFSDYQCTTQYYGPCPYWLGDCYEGWARSHGTPIPNNIQSPDAVYMFNNKQNDGAGEGIYHSYTFNAGDIITIKVKIKDLSAQYISGLDYSNVPPAPEPTPIFSSIAGAKIEIWAIQDLATFQSNVQIATVSGCGELSTSSPSSTLALLPPYNAWYTTPPTATPPGLGVPELLGSYTVAQINNPGLPDGPLSNELLTFTKTITTNNTEILIMANFDDQYSNNPPPQYDGRQTDLTIDYIEIEACRGGFVEYSQNNSFVPDGVIMKDFINIGHWTNSTLVSAQSNKNTELYAAATNVFGTFDCTVDDEHYFLIDTKEYCGTISAKPGRHENEEHSETSKPQLSDTTPFKPTIYPNPTTGSFNIEIPQRGNYTIRVMNMMGSTVYEGNMTNEQKKSILLDNNLPPGNYTIHISGDGLRHVERITLVK